MTASKKNTGIFIERPKDIDDIGVLNFLFPENESDFDSKKSASDNFQNFALNTINNFSTRVQAEFKSYSDVTPFGNKDVSDLKNDIKSYQAQSIDTLRYSLGFFASVLDFYLAYYFNYEFDSKGSDGKVSMQELLKKHLERNYKNTQKNGKFDVSLFPTKVHGKLPESLDVLIKAFPIDQDKADLMSQDLVTDFNKYVKALVTMLGGDDENRASLVLGKVGGEWKLGWQAFKVAATKAPTDSTGSERLDSNTKIPRNNELQPDPKGAPVSEGNNNERKYSFGNRGLIYICSLIALLGALAFVLYQGYIFKEQNLEIKSKELKLKEDSFELEKVQQLRDERKVLLTNLYSAISQDLSLSQKRNLSSATISRIISLSHEFEPYRQSADSKKVISPERGELLFNLFQYDLGDSSINIIMSKADFSYSDLSGLDLNGFDWGNYLSGITGRYHKEVEILITANKRLVLHHSIFNDADLTGAFLYADLENSTFHNTILNQTDFYWSDMDHCDFEGSMLLDCSFRWLNMMHTNFQGSTIESCSFTYCDLRGANFNKSIMRPKRLRTSFYDCYFSSSGTFFEYSTELNVSNAYLKGRPKIEESKIYSDDAIPIIEFKSSTEVNMYGLGVDDSLDILTGKFMATVDSEEREMHYIIHPNFTGVGNNGLDINEFFSSLSVSNYQRPADNRLTTHKVRTRDNFDRSSKHIRNMTRLAGIDLEDAGVRAWDTLYYKSGDDFLRAYYRGKKYDMAKHRTIETMGVASFENSRLSDVLFSESDMRKVSFKGANFAGDMAFEKVLIDESNFQLASGLFSFTSCRFERVKVNREFSLDSFSTDERQYLRIEDDNLVNFEKYPEPVYLDLGTKYAKGIRRW